jgi:hypothetical protein
MRKTIVLEIWSAGFSPCVHAIPKPPQIKLA